MDDKINNANTKEMKEDKAMQEVSTENLENVAGGNSYTDKIKEGVQISVMTQKEKDKIDSLCRSYWLRTVALGYGAPDIFRPIKLRIEGEPVKELESETDKDKLEAFAKKHPYYPKLKPFLKYDK